MLIDAHNAVWRASIGFAPKKTAPLSSTGWTDNGQPDSSTNDEFTMREAPPLPEPEKKEPQDESLITVFNFFRNLRPLVEDGAPDKCFFVLEGHPQFRYDLFADYKANRIIKQAANQESRNKFQKATDHILRVMQHLPITIVRAPNYEADDVVATLCDNMKDEDLTVISNDSDYIQLLQRGYPHITIYNPIKKEAMVAPEYPYVAWKCLNGDKSDNIPALLKPKKALEAVNNPEAFKKFMDIEENRANFSINRQLIEFRSVPEDEIELKEGIRDYTRLKAEFLIMDFQSIINDKSWEKYTNTFDCIRY
jgi:5'-3' exonuclease